MRYPPSPPHPHRIHRALPQAGDKDGDGVVNLVDFTALTEGCEGCKLSGEKIEQVYNMYNDGGSGSGFSKETLFLASRSYYFVAAETVLSSTENLEGETVRRLELKELLEVLDGASLLTTIFKDTTVWHGSNQV